ncbi:50S ribosomal protein L15 [archaeon]|nr:MAG: 50S ribosomal protein L15 [archaeon]
MVIRRDGKRSQRRGHRTYHGSHKKWRGGGSRGGRGQAGMHKHKWSWVVKYDPGHFGKEGFKVPEAAQEKVRTINVGQLEKLAQGKDTINLKEHGYQKVLGSGKIGKAVTVEAKYFSKSAIKKLEAAGGKAVVAS